jgi:hypothetical protein
MKIPINKEHGSWAVFILSSAAGVTTGLLTRPWLQEREYALVTLLTLLGLALLINSKNPLSSAIRSKDGRGEHLCWFGLFAITGIIFLMPLLIEGFNALLVFSIIILSYVVLLFLGKEHALITEINGFGLLCLSGPIVYFVITGEMSLKLYFAVTVFFTAGVFKVRARLKKTAAYRWLMVLYCMFSFLVFYGALKIPVIVLLPLLENLISMAWLREEKLRTTGNIELIKGVLFTLLLGFYWHQG